VNADAERRRYFGVGCAAREKPCNLQLSTRESRRLSIVFIIDCNNADISAGSCITRLGRLITRYYAISVTLQIEEHVTNTMGYQNARVDTLFAEAPKQTDAAKAQAMYTELQSILTEEVPVIWLTELEFPVFINRRLRNVNIDANGPNSEFDEAHLAP